MRHQANNITVSSFTDSKHAGTLRYLTIASMIVTPCLSMAAADGGLGDTTCTFLKTIAGVLNAVSIVVVTIAIIFSGYQIAFAHKRISDVAPVFIGALIIGAASQIAKLFLGGSSTLGGGAKCDFGSLSVEPLTQLASIVQSLAHYA